jgi:predicted acylesterase/phospholipase RssA
MGLPVWLRDIKYLVFSGGGVRGLAFLGAFSVLEKEFQREYHTRLLSQIQGCAGSSAGAFLALLACLDLSSGAMKEKCFLIDGYTILRNMNIFQLSQEWGLNNKSDFHQLIRETLRESTGDPDITFGKLFSHTGKKLVVTASCMNDGTLHYLSHETTPDLPVYIGVTASMCIPLLFSPTRIGDQIFVDGGFLENLPLCAFPVNESIGFLLSRSLPPSIDGFSDYLTRILFTSVNALERYQIESLSSEEKQRIVRINTGSQSSFQFAMDLETKDSMCKLGALSMYLFLDPELLVQYFKNVALETLLSMVTPNK